jgi:FtsP/CotA-like multicopper oxidase with cupredoxin domain
MGPGAGILLSLYVNISCARHILTQISVILRILCTSASVSYTMLFLGAIWVYAATLTLAGTTTFTLDLTWGRGAPDGYERGMIFINGQYPGPLLEIQQDDWVEIEVRNQLPFNTTLHFHGNDRIQGLSYSRKLRLHQVFIK